MKCAHRRRSCGGGYVKVRMEGVAIGRKVDVSLHGSYEELLRTLARMFPSTNEGVGADVEGEAAAQPAMRPALEVPAGGQIVALPQDVPVAPPRKSSPLASDSGPPRGPRPWSRPAAWAGAPLSREQANLVGARGRELGRRRACVRVLRELAGCPSPRAKY